MAADFEQCVAKESFLKLPEWQLAILLQRDDLNVAREETVLQGLLAWRHASDNAAHGGLPVPFSARPREAQGS